MKTCNLYFSVGIITLFCMTGCQNRDSRTKAELMNIELLRGDIIMCGGKDFGDVSFATACQDSVRETFDLAISLLHSFEYEEAEKAFVKVIDADPDCVMAYWGVAMSLYPALWAPPDKEKLEKGAKILRIAASLPKTEREKDYLDAVRVYYNDWEHVDARTRATKLANSMEALYNKYRDDTEAAIFYALTLNATADPTDKSYANQRKAGQILEPLFLEKPNHPGIAHYIIHSYDNPGLASRALSTARKYSSIAPASAHAQHMPSHIFVRLGLWGEAIQSNLNSTSSAICYAESAGFDGHWDEELHGMDYLVYAYLQEGNNAKAIEQNSYLNTIKKVYPVNFKDAYAIAAIPARIVLENKNWKNAAVLNFSPIGFPWEKFPWQSAILHFTRALGAAHLGDIQQAEKEIQALRALHKVLVDRNVPYEANQVQIQLNAAQAWLDFANGSYDSALVLMREAAEMEDNTTKHPVTPCEVLPARELLGDMLLAMHKNVDAFRAYEQDLKDHPNRLNGLYGAAVALKNQGKAGEANNYFEKLVELTGSTDTDRPEIKEAKRELLTINQTK